METFSGKLHLAGGKPDASDRSQAPPPPALYVQHLFNSLTAPIPPWTTGGQERFRPFSRPSTQGLWVDRSTHAETDPFAARGVTGKALGMTGIAGLSFPLQEVNRPLKPVWRLKRTRFGPKRRKTVPLQEGNQPLKPVWMPKRNGAGRFREGLRRKTPEICLVPVLCGGPRRKHREICPVPRRVMGQKHIQGRFVTLATPA